MNGYCFKSVYLGTVCCPSVANQYRCGGAGVAGKRGKSRSIGSSTNADSVPSCALAIKVSQWTQWTWALHCQSTIHLWPLTRNFRYLVASPGGAVGGAGDVPGEWDLG